MLRKHSISIHSEDPIYQCPGSGCVSRHSQVQDFHKHILSCTLRGPPNPDRPSGTVVGRGSGLSKTDFSLFPEQKRGRPTGPRLQPFMANTSLLTAPQLYASSTPMDGDGGDLPSSFSSHLPLQNENDDDFEASAHDDDDFDMGEGGMELFNTGNSEISLETIRPLSVGSRLLQMTPLTGSHPIKVKEELKEEEIRYPEGLFESLPMGPTRSTPRTFSSIPSCSSISTSTPIAVSSFISSSSSSSSATTSCSSDLFQSATTSVVRVSDASAFSAVHRGPVPSPSVTLMPQPQPQLKKSQDFQTNSHQMDQFPLNPPTVAVSSHTTPMATADLPIDDPFSSLFEQVPVPDKPIHTVKSMLPNGRADSQYCENTENGNLKKSTETIRKGIRPLQSEAGDIRLLAFR